MAGRVFLQPGSIQVKCTCIHFLRLESMSAHSSNYVPNVLQLNNGWEIIKICFKWLWFWITSPQFPPIYFELYTYQHNRRTLRPKPSSLMRLFWNRINFHKCWILSNKIDWYVNGVFDKRSLKSTAIIITICTNF